MLARATVTQQQHQQQQTKTKTLTFFYRIVVINGGNRKKDRKGAHLKTHTYIDKYLKGQKKQ